MIKGGGVLVMRTVVIGLQHIGLSRGWDGAADGIVKVMGRSDHWDCQSDGTE